MRQPNDNECHGFAEYLSMVSTTSTRLADMDSNIPLHRAFKSYLDSRGLSHDILDDSYFQKYFLAYIYLKTYIALCTYRSFLKEEDRNTYSKISADMPALVDSKYKISIFDDTEVAGLISNFCLHSNLEPVYIFVNFYMSFIGDSSDLNRVFYRDFFVEDLTAYRVILIKAIKDFRQNPENFANKSGCAALFILFTLLSTASIGSLLWII